MIRYLRQQENQGLRYQVLATLSHYNEKDNWRFGFRKRTAHYFILAESCTYNLLYHFRVYSFEQEKKNSL